MSHRRKSERIGTEKSGPPRLNQVIDVHLKLQGIQIKDFTSNCEGGAGDLARYLHLTYNCQWKALRGKIQIESNGE